MHVKMSYGRHGLELSLPEAWAVTVIRKKRMPSIEDPAKAVAAALAAPAGSPPLSRLAGPGRKACILICDITRPVPNHLFLRPSTNGRRKCSSSRCAGAQYTCTPTGRVRGSATPPGLR